MQRRIMAGLGLTDKPVSSVEEESLGIHDYMIALSDFIESCETPMTIAIQADWGAGKTSMMNLVKERLSEKNKRIETIWFNTWQFSQFDMGDDLPISLLTQFVKRLGGEDSGEVVQKLASLTKKAGGMLAKVALGKAAGDLIDGGGKVVDALFEENLDISEQIVKLKGDIESIVEKKIAKDGNDRVVVFIDDLDRLVPEKAVELLEVMKLFLDVPRCVFVLAVDYNVVIKGLEKKFGSSVDDLKGKSFFDKIIQLPFNLPVAQYDVSKYFKELLSGKFDYNDEDIEIFVKLANSSVGFNPRSMKRLFNSLQLLNMVARSKNILGSDAVATAQEKQRILFAILCLQTAYEPVYRYMLKNRSKINQEFFDLFIDMDTLKESPYFSEIKRELGVEDDEDEKLLRFVEFINNFYEAIQLASDTSENADENLTDKELENLMRFLSFSSITTNNNQGINASSGTLPFKAIIKPFMDEAILPKFSNILRRIGVERPEIWSDNNHGIRFSVNRGGLFFEFAVFLEGGKAIVTELWSVDNILVSKRETREWCEAFLKDDFPSMTYNARKKYGFINLERIELDDHADSEEIMQRYKAALVSSYEKFLPKIVDFYNRTEELHGKCVVFARKLAQKIDELFPREEGWKIKKDECSRLGPLSEIAITHEAWQESPLAIKLMAQRSFCNDLSFGLYRERWGVKYEEEESLRNLMNERLGAGDYGAVTVYDAFFEPSVRYTVEGNIYGGTGASFRYKDEQEENEAIETIVSTLATMKSFKDDIAELSKRKITE